MKQRTTNNNKNENMKMRKTLITALVLGACVSTQLFAQNTKEDTITFSLTAQGQSSVSTSTAPNAGNWSDGPSHYKTGSKKLTQTDVLRAIAIVVHGNPNYYSSKAKLALVQGELSGFFNIYPDLSNSVADINTELGCNTTGGSGLNGTFTTADSDWDTTLPNSFDSTYARLATGRHFLEVPAGFLTEGEYPPGHMQPWGQIFVKDPGHINNSVTDPFCENVTYFFALTVQECYDCFYLNSFISDSTFTFKSATGGGPPCCSTPENMLGKGVDKYYLTLSFDNSVNNPYLNCSDNNGHYVGYDGLDPDSSFINGIDGIDPDVLPYVDAIRSGIVQHPSPYQMRFTLNGIVTYNWQLKFVNPNSDVFPDFVGTASYSANGYGFIGLICQLMTGSATFTEKIVKTETCCLDQPWFDWWYGVGNYSPGSDYPVSANQNLYFDETSFYPSTPFNVGPSLSYHANFNEAYEPWEVETTW
jgi:hypothetical protein